MVKVYYTYNFHQVIGQVLSKNCNFVYYPKSKSFITGVNQYVAIISAKTGEVQHYMHKQNKNVPVRHIYVHDNKVYAGYEDGQIIVWSITSQQQLFSFDLHKSTISSIIVWEQQSKLISAGFDGNIMIWDLLSQQCQTIKSAHPSMITEVIVTKILIKGSPTPVILSVGKDGFFRIWDLKTQICLGAISCQVTEAYCMFLDRQRNIVYVGTNKQDIVTIQLEQSNDGKQIAHIRGIFHKKSYSRCVQIVVELSKMYIFNADKNIEVYKFLTGKQQDARKKRLLSRRKKNQQDPQIPQQSQTQLKLIEQKVIPFRFYNSFVHQGIIYLNNGSNIISQDQELTQGAGRTQQICLQYPFIVQNSTNSLNIYNSNTSNKLFSIKVKAGWCHLFSSGYLLVIAEQSVQIWNLLKNEQVYRLEQKWSGCWARKNKCLLWRDNQIGFYQIGYDKNKNIKIKMVESKRFEDKISEVKVKNSMDKYIVNLQNSQIYINYLDTHKNFLKLYGHKLPILAFDISSDDNLIATGSVDKDIRIWDMDFGYSIKTIFAHQEAVNCVKFIPETHYLLSASKDGHLKFWDMDTYQLIMDFEQCTMQIKSIAVSQSGDYIIAGGLDQGIRIWKQTNEQTIASDMEEKKMQKIMIQDYAKQKLQKEETKVRYEDLKHGQQIIQALQNKQSPKIIISLLKKIPPANLKSCLSFLHQKHARRLEQYIKLSISGNYEQEVCWRVIRQLDRGSQLGKQMRLIWRPIQKTIQLNTQILKTWLKSIEEENEFIIK